VAQDGSVCAELSPAPVEELGSGVPTFRGKVASGKSGDGDMKMEPSVEESGDPERNPEPKPIASKVILPPAGNRRSKGNG
jgi:hypothetical protein